MISSSSALIRNWRAWPAAAYYALWILLSKGVSFAMLPLMTRFLPPEEYGKLDLLATVSDLGGIVLGLGLVQVLYRYGFGVDGGRYRSTVLALMSCSALGGGILLQLAIPVFQFALPASLEIVQLRIACYTLVLTGLVQLPLARLQMDNQAGRYLIFAVLQLLLQISLTIALLLIGYGVTGVLVANALAATVMAVMLICFELRLYPLRLHRSCIEPVLRYGLPLIFSSLALLALGNLDFLILANVVGVAQLAIYGIAVKVAIIATVITQPFLMWWHPRRLRILSGADGARLSAQVLYYLVAWGIAGCSLVAIAAEPMIILLTTPAYHAAAQYVPGLCVAGVLALLSSLANVGCFVGRSGHAPAVVNGLSALVALLLYWFWIPSWGIEGAVLATIAAYLFRFVFFYLWSQRIYPLPYPVWRVLALLAMWWPASLLIITLCEGWNQLIIGLLFALPAAVVSLRMAPRDPRALLQALAAQEPSSAR